MNSPVTHYTLRNQWRNISSTDVVISDSYEDEQVQGMAREFICQVISQAYTDLVAWAVPYSTFKQWQKRDLERSFERSMIAELLVFFLGSDDTGDTSMLQILIQTYHIELDYSAIIAKIKPLLKEAFTQINLYLVQAGKQPYLK